jgi:hypothetical protein
MRRQCAGVVATLASSRAREHLGERVEARAFAHRHRIDSRHRRAIVADRRQRMSAVHDQGERVRGATESGSSSSARSTSSAVWDTHPSTDVAGSGPAVDDGRPGCVARDPGRLRRRGRSRRRVHRRREHGMRRHRPPAVGDAERERRVRASAGQPASTASSESACRVWVDDRAQAARAPDRSAAATTTLRSAPWATAFRSSSSIVSGFTVRRVPPRSRPLPGRRSTSATRPKTVELIGRDPSSSCTATSCALAASSAAADLRRTRLPSGADMPDA